MFPYTICHLYMSSVRYTDFFFVLFLVRSFIFMLSLKCSLCMLELFLFLLLYIIVLSACTRDFFLKPEHSCRKKKKHPHTNIFSFFVEEMEKYFFFLEKIVFLGSFDPES